MVPATKPPMINLDDWRENSVCTMSMKIKGEFIPPSRVCIYIYIYRDEGPRYRYWAVGHTRGQVNTNESIQFNGPWKKSGHKELEMLSKEKHILS